MISKKIYFRIILYISLIVSFSVILGFLIVNKQPVRYSLLCLFIIVIVAGSLVSYLNRTNRNMKLFFDSVKNEDSSLTFAAEDFGTGLRELHESMNRVNRQIQQLKIKNREQEQFFKIILEQLATGIITYDRKGFIHHSNSAARNLLSLDSLTHLRQLEKTEDKLYSAVKSLKPFERRLIEVNTGNSGKQLSLKSTSFGKDDEELMILSIQDIRQELEEREIDSWMRLIRVLMHEIMNSITPITSLSESLSKLLVHQEDQLPPERITDQTVSSMLKGLNVIKEQGQGLMSFVESYRKLTRLPQPDKKVFKVSGLMSRVEMLCNPLLEANKLEIEFRYDDPGKEILADENLISQVLINLIKNAIEANETNNNTRIIVSSEIAGNHPRICVIDNGQGISKEILKEIFVPFFTTRENGSGIGLSISRQIMKAHGGDLTARSIPGRETVFCMTFRS